MWRKNLIKKKKKKKKKKRTNPGQNTHSTDTEDITSKS